MSTVLFSSANIPASDALRAALDTTQSSVTVHVVAIDQGPGGTYGEVAGLVDDTRMFDFPTMRVIVNNAQVGASGPVIESVEGIRDGAGVFVTVTDLTVGDRVVRLGLDGSGPSVVGVVAVGGVVSA